MLRLVVADLVANARIWAGALLVAAVTAVVGCVAGSEIETAVRTGGNVALALYAVNGVVIALSGIAALVVAGSVAGLTVTAQQREYALWQLAGVRPGLVRLVVTGQLALVGLAGAALGVLLAQPVPGPVFRLAFGDQPDFAGIEPRFGVITAASVLGLVTALVTLGGSRAARRAGRTPPILSLRTAEAPPASMTVTRWVLGVFAVLVVAAIVVSLPGTDRDRLAVPLMLVGPLVAGALGAFTPLYLAAFLSAWASVVPPTASAAWYLARNSTAFNVSRSTATISPLVVAVALAGSLYSAEATAGSSSPSLGSVVLLLGGPLLLSVLGAAVTVFMAGRGRERESQLVIAAGGTPGLVRTAAIAEAVIYVVTAVLLGLVAVSVTALTGAVVVGEAPHFGVRAVAAVAASGLVLMLLATLAPGVTPAGRRRVRPSRPATRPSASAGPPAPTPR